MNFFESQQLARRQSRRLILLFALAVISIVLAINAALVLGLATQLPSEVRLNGGIAAVFDHHGGLLVVVSLITLAVILISSLVRIGSLREGGAVVARQLGGREVTEDTRDPELRRLRNVVEEIAIAASVPVPQIFVLDHEDGINAFAAGYAPEDAAVAVTRGALLRLNREELQGVIAHEFSHVLNGDMRLNIRLVGVLFGILVLAIAARRVLEVSRGGRDSKGFAAVLLVALAVMIVGYLGLFFGRLIKAGVSRQREYLADASAVQFTRQSRGIAGALKKIGGLPAGSKLKSDNTEEMAHMLFGDGVGFSSMFATHPPLVRRIAALEPGFDQSQLQALAAGWATAPPHGLDEDRLLGIAGANDLPAARNGLPEATAELPLAPAAVVAQVAHPAPDDYLRAASIHEAIPAALHEAAAQPESAYALVLALLLDAGTSLRDRQRAVLLRTLGEQMLQQVDALAPEMDGLHPMLRLPLASLAFPALRRHAAIEQALFLATCDQLIHADGEVRLFEYCLSTLLQRQLRDSANPARRSMGRRKLSSLARECAGLLALLAQQGHRAEEPARRAYLAALHAILPQAALPYRPSSDWRRELDRILPQLDELEPPGKQLLVEALAICSTHDGRISVAEAELLRTLCACLHCPLPPVLEK